MEVLKFQKKIMYRFFIIYLIYSQFSWAQHPFFQLNIVDNRLSFQSKLTQSIEIKAFRIYFFSHPSCYQGYMQDIHMTTLKRNVLIQPQQFFSLSKQYIFQLARDVLSEKEFKNVHAILMQLKLDTKTFITFDGLCSDQLINCCLAIDCSRGKECEIVQQYGTQFLL